MRRLAATLRRDVILQHRYRFYAVSLLMVVFWGGILSLALRTGQADEALVVPAFMLANLIVTTFYFMAAMVLLERAEGMLAVLVVTPLRDVEYFTSKMVSLGALGLAESLFIVLILFGWPPRMLPLVLGTLALGALYVLAGFISIVRYDSINEWIMPSAVVVAVFCLPLLPHFGSIGSEAVWLHPFEPPMVLLRSAYERVETWEVAYGLVGSTAWMALGLIWARRRFQQFVVRSAGGR